MFDLSKLNEEFTWSIMIGNEMYEVEAQTSSVAVRVALFDYLGAKYWEETDRAWWMFLDNADIMEMLPESLEIYISLVDSEEDASVEEIKYLN